MLGGVGLVLTGCDAPTPSTSGLFPYSYRYRLSVRVDAFGASYDAGGIHQYRYREGLSAFGSMDAGAVGIKGEAIPVPLGSNGLLVLTLRESATRPAVFGHRWPVDQVARDAFGPSLRRRAFLGRGSRPIPVRDLPLGVLFPKPSDPSSVVPLTPDLDVRIRSAALMLTRSPLTEGVIGRSLPWLDRYLREGLQLDGDSGETGSLDRPFANTLSAYDLKSTSY